MLSTALTTCTPCNGETRLASRKGCASLVGVPTRWSSSRARPSPSLGASKRPSSTVAASTSTASRPRSGAFAERRGNESTLDRAVARRGPKRARGRLPDCGTRSRRSGRRLRRRRARTEPRALRARPSAASGRQGIVGEPVGVALPPLDRRPILRTDSATSSMPESASGKEPCSTSTRASAPVWCTTGWSRSSASPTARSRARVGRSGRRTGGGGIRGPTAHEPRRPPDRPSRPNASGTRPAAVGVGARRAQRPPAHDGRGCRRASGWAT